MDVRWTLWQHCSGQFLGPIPSRYDYYSLSSGGT